jgi:hypothetical protein
MVIMLSFMCMQIAIKHGDIAITVVNMTSWWLQIVVQPVINRGCANNTWEYQPTSGSKPSRTGCVQHFDAIAMGKLLGSLWE